MSSTPTDFVSLAVEGEVPPEAIDDYVARWHRDPKGLELHQYLGMDEAEYARWVVDPDALLNILQTRSQRVHRPQLQ